VGQGPPGLHQQIHTQLTQKVLKAASRGQWAPSQARPAAGPLHSQTFLLCWQGLLVAKGWGDGSGPFFILSDRTLGAFGHCWLSSRKESPEC
jgi:hypothetical protein